MHEPSPSGAADALVPNDPSGLQRRLTAILQSSPAPTVCVARTIENGGDLMLAGSSLLELIRHRIAALQHAGMRRGDVIASDATGVSRVIDALAAILGGFVYWPCEDQRRLSQGPLVSDSSAPLIWRPNPLIGVGLSPGLPHEPPAAMPMRLSIQLRDALAPAGVQVRVLADGSESVAPFAINAQTIGRLGSTLRRRLGIKRQSVRYCAAPAQSAVGILLDLLPGIAARQVMVLPTELTPSSATIVRAIARYHPDSMTLTLDQAKALAETPMDEPTQAALRRTHVLIADAHPIPVSLREHMTPLVARLNVAYVLPEAGDAFVM